MLFGLRAVRRRKWIVIGVAAALVALTVGVVSVIPPKYHVECRLLAQRNQVLVTRSDGQGATDPAQSANEIVLRQENLIGLAKQTDLLKEWEARRLPILRLKDWIMGLISEPPTEKEKLRGLVEFLRTRMAVWSEEATITIQISWPDADMAYRLVDAAQRSFLEAKHVQEVSTFVESVSILEGHAADLSRQVDAALREIDALRQRKRDERLPSGSVETPTRVVVPGAATRPAPAPQEPSAEAKERTRRLAELPVEIQEKQRVFDELEGYRRRRLAELQSKLEEQSAVYTQEHPAVADVRQAIAVASKESPQVGRLRAELGALKAEQARLMRASRADEREAVPATRGRTGIVVSGPATGPDAALAELSREDERDPEVEYARAKLKFAIDNYQALQEQIRRTRMDLDTAQAAFKYRYVLTQPPERPRGPMSPKKGLIIAAGLICGLLIGTIGAVGREMRDGIINERWQVEQILAMPVLTDIQLLPPEPEKSV